MHAAHALSIWRLVRLWVRRTWGRKAVLVRGVWWRMMAISRPRGIGMGPVVVRSRAGRILVVSRRLHRGIIGRSCWLEAWPRPVSRIRSAAILLCPLHLPNVLLLMNPMRPCLTGLHPSHGHIPTLPLAKLSLAEFHLPFLAFTFLPLPVRDVPLLVVFHHPDGTLWVVFLRRPQLLSMRIHLRWRPARVYLSRGTGVRVRPWRAHCTRHRATRQSPLFPSLFRRG